MVDSITKTYFSETKPDFSLIQMRNISNTCQIKQTSANEEDSIFLSNFEQSFFYTNSNRSVPIKSLKLRTESFFTNLNIKTFHISMFDNSNFRRSVRFHKFKHRSEYSKLDNSIIRRNVPFHKLKWSKPANVDARRHSANIFRCVRDLPTQHWGSCSCRGEFVPSYVVFINN